MSDSVVQQIKDRLDIVEVVSGYLKLEKTGINLRARCPFHQEKGPSFFVSPARQMFKCFGCGAGGSVFDFIMKIEGLEFPEALRLLAKRAGVELSDYKPQDQTERTRLLEICDLATQFFVKQLHATSVGKKCQEYFFKRGLSQETILKWRLGYSPSPSVGGWRALSDFLVGRGFSREEVVKAGLAVDTEKTQTPYDRFRGRIMFPIFDINSQVIGFGARKTDFLEANKDEGPKYLNIPNTLLYDKSRVLYGLNEAKMAIRQNNCCILTEGYMDVILSHQAGFTNTVAASGTALTNIQLGFIKRYTNNLYTAFDRDTAGGSATQRGIDLAQKENFDIKVILMPQDKDPADLISHNKDDWQKAIEGAKDITEFYFEEALARFDAKTPQGKKQIANFFLPQIKKLPNSILVSHWISKLAQVLGVSAESISDELKKMPGGVLRQAQDGTQSRNTTEESNFFKESSQERNRLQMLEEKILGLALKESKFLDFMDNDDIELFSPQFKTLLAGLKIDNSKSFENDLAVKTIVDNCLFQIEAQEPEDPELEIQVCLEGFRRLAWQNQLKKYGDELKLAEREGNLEKKKEVLEKINSLTKNRPA